MIKASHKTFFCLKTKNFQKNNTLIKVGTLFADNKAALMQKIKERIKKWNL